MNCLHLNYALNLGSKMEQLDFISFSTRRSRQQRQQPYLDLLLMSGYPDQKQVKKTYSWTNKQEYPNVEIKQAVQKMLSYEDDNKEHLNVINLFDSVKNSSQLTLLHIDDKKKQMNLYSLPKRKTSFQVEPEKIKFAMNFSSIRNRFSYLMGFQYRMGGQGPIGYLGAFMNGNKKLFTLSYLKFLGQRVDNYYKATNDRIEFKCIWQKVKYWDSLWLGAARVSRQNQISFYDQNEKNTKIFGILSPQKDIPKHSNIYELSYKWVKNPFSIYGAVGYDFSNNSLFKLMTISSAKYINLSQNADLFITLEASNLWGRNILKNDYLFKNKKYWLGSRTKNSISPRVQLIFKKYPFLQSLKLKPFLYTQLWTSFTKNQLNSFDTSFEAQYGIGVTSSYYSFKFEMGLFKFSGERKGNMFGNFKFNF